MLNRTRAVEAGPTAPAIKGMYHFAFPCRDAEQTRAFCEDVVGLPLVHCMQVQSVPSSGETGPYAHFIFELGDGSYLAFYDLGRDEMPQPSPNAPPWVWLKHARPQADA